MNDAVVNICMQVFERICVFISFGYITIWVGFLGDTVGNSRFKLWGTLRLFSKVNVLFYILTSNVGVEFAHVLVKTYLPSFFIIAILVNMTWRLVILICTSLITNGIENLLMYLLATYIFLENYLFRSFPKFSLDCVFIFELQEYLFWIQTLITYMISKPYLPLCALSFHFLDGIFEA